MRKIFVLQFILILCACSSTIAPPPDWYKKMQAGNYETIGYGEGNMKEEARANAKNDIAKSIQSQIHSENKFEKNLENNKFSERGKITVTDKTDVVLTDVNFDKEEQRGNTWYVAARYENLSIENKFAKRAMQLKQSCREERQNKYLGQTPLVKTINKELRCKPDIRIARKNKLWYLTYGNIMLPLINDDFEKLFNPYASLDVDLKPSSEMLTEGDVLTFTVATKNDGYISLLNVYGNGEVFIISSNQPTKANKKISVPDPSIDQELVSGLLTPGKHASDLYVAVYNKNKIDLSRIQQAGGKVENDEEHFKFGELLDMLDEYEFSSVLIRTKPKSE